MNSNMAKKKMNKMLLLPLFLGVVTLSAAGILTGVHLLTQPFIERNELNKKYEGYKKILEIDSFDTVNELTLEDPLKQAGVTLKQNFIINSEIVGVVYDANVTGWESDLIFQVGFKGNVYAGFNLISSKETPGMGADYLKLVDSRIKGKSVDQPVLIDNDGTYTGVTAPITGNAVKEVLELCARDYSGSALPEPEETTIENLRLALNNENADTFTATRTSGALNDGGVLFKYAVNEGEVEAGVVYEAKLKAFAPDLHFLVGIKDGTFVGFHVIASKETPDYGGDYLAQVKATLVGKAVSGEVLNDEPVSTGITKTADAVKGVISLIATDYSNGGN